MKTKALVWIALFCLFSTAQAVDAEKEAVEAALTWLKLVDKGDYDKSWDEASAYFRAAVSRENWNKSLEKVRKPLGKAGTREVKSALYTRTLPGAPNGEYVVIQFSTSFANKDQAVETITPTKGIDGKWRVSGYYIR